MGGNFKCYSCQKYFTHHRSLQRHIDDQHRRPRRFECRECNRTYGRVDNLRVHTRKHHEGQTGRNSGRRVRSPEGQSQSPVRRNSHSRSPVRRKSNHSSPLRNRRLDVVDQGSRSGAAAAPKEKANDKTSPKNVSRSRESEKGCDDVGELIIDVSPVTRQCVDLPVEEGSTTPLSGKARGMWAMQEADRRAADSTTEDVTESEGPDDEPSDVPSTDIRRVQLGKDIGSIDAYRALEGTPVNVREHSTAAWYGEQGVKVFQEGKEREYRMVVQHSPAGSQISGITKMHKTSQSEIGTPLSTKELEVACVGRVKNIKQTVKREAFREGVLVWKEETITNFEVDLEAGFLTKDRC